MTQGSSKLTINSAKRSLSQQFKQAGQDSPDLDARLLLMAASGLDYADIIARGTDIITPDVFAKLQSYAQRRLSGEPIDHILGYRDFYGRRFHISKDVLSPRPETEGLIDLALQHYDKDSQIKCLDLGTGSGAIIITLLSERPMWEAVASDLSSAALDVAKRNGDEQGVVPQLRFALGSWFDAVEGQFDLIVSNPPYIDKAHMERLSPEVKGYDPDLALFGGEDGLGAYRDIINGAPDYLVSGGRIILEIGYDQAVAVTQILGAHGFSDVACFKDLSGHDRIMTGVI